MELGGSQVSADDGVTTPGIKLFCWVSKIYGFFAFTTNNPGYFCFFPGVKPCITLLGFLVTLSPFQVSGSSYGIVPFLFFLILLAYNTFFSLYFELKGTKLKPFTLSQIPFHRA